MGGPAICPSCDCGNFGVDVVKRQAARIRELEADVSVKARLLTNQTAAIEAVTIERCAQLASDFLTDRLLSVTGSELANAIRALKPTTVPG